MKVTPAMLQAARRAEYDFFNRNRTVKDNLFIPTPDSVIRVMLEAALKTLDPPSAPGTKPEVSVEAKAARKISIVTAPRPKRR